MRDLCRQLGRKCFYVAGMFLNPSLGAIKPNLPTCCQWGEGPWTAAERKQRSSKAQVFKDTLLAQEEFLAICREGGQRWTLISAVLSAEAEGELLCAGRSALASPLLWSRLLVEALSHHPAFFPTTALCCSVRVCLDDSALLCSAAYTCSLSVNNCINFIGSPSLNRLRFVQQTGLVPGPPEQRLLVRGRAQAARRMGGLSKRM